MSTAAGKKAAASASATEQTAAHRLAGLPVDLPSTAVVSNVFRVANAARNYLEREVLREFGLSFSGFTVIWVLWIDGPQETRQLAVKAAITKGTLTGVLKTLEALGFVRRSTPPADRRLTVVSLTPKGKRRMRVIFPRFNAAEAQITAELNAGQRQQLAARLRQLLAQLEQLAANSD